MYKDRRFCYDVCMDYTFEKILRLVQKPGRYVGGERGAVIKDKKDVDLRFAFCFPDTYEIGMSHLGMKILYNIINEQPDMWCERVFAPWFDMREQMAENNIPLYALESRDKLTAFDIVGFTLQYELSYTNILYMLELAGIPYWAKDRGEHDPIIVAGGPCACNPEPVAGFFDAFLLGEGEENLLELCRTVQQGKRHGKSKHDILKKLTKMPGVYVPAFYEPEYNKDGTIKSISREKFAPLRVTKQYIADFDAAPYPEHLPVPMIEVVHDRAAIEVLRGCIRGCRFCQAGFLYRPFRHKDAVTLDCQAKALCENTGYEELSLVSLSTSDYPEIDLLLDSLLDWTEDKKVNLSLPSLRIDSYSDELVEKTTRIKRSGLTFAPEAGTQRLRDVINKNIDETEIMRGAKTAFAAGYTNVKLYFMMGLPTETDDDIRGIIEVAQKIVDLYYSMPSKPKGKAVSVSISCACFVPKPFTPFQFFAQDTTEDFARKQRLLKDSIYSKKISVNWHDASTSFVEAVLARGDRRLCGVIADVYKDGGIFDSWDEGFSLKRWQNAFDKNGIDPAFYANREREYAELQPWDMFDYGIDKEFLIKEYERAKQAGTTPNCAEQCANCGIVKYTGRACFAERKA